MTAPDGPRVVALGGGHGLAASLTALRELTGRLTAVVTVADDGGSSGRLRAELGALPPGDLRMALAALSASDEWQRLFQYRFGGSGPLAGHAVGNLILAALTDLMSGPVAALDLAASVLQVAGRVLPMSEAPVDIVAEVLDRSAAPGPSPVREVRGQVAVATTTGRVRSVRLVPAQPRACPDAVEAIRSADAVVLGPGSLFTSVLPHLLTPGLREAIGSTSGRVILVLNLVAQQGETSGYSPAEHLDALAGQVADLRLDCVIADSAAVSDQDALTSLTPAVERLGATLHLAPVAVPGEPRHDPGRLAEAFRKVLGA